MDPPLPLWILRTVCTCWDAGLYTNVKPQIFATDAETKFSQKLGWTLGERTGRYALIVDHGKVTYAEQAAKGGVEGTDASSVLAKL